MVVVVLPAQERQQTMKREIRTWLSKEKPSLQYEDACYSEVDCLVLVFTSPHSRGILRLSRLRYSCGSVICSSRSKLTGE